ncbi:hypothetical protein PALB_13360 [Pseudoalteromonas luteoviolacea B = ATCC 29581]|nr:hypothetical protein PALB_13360 [Pseudoalteromonas luteoviolacea B = ATCC 29581]
MQKFALSLALLLSVIALLLALHTNNSLQQQTIKVDETAQHLVPLSTQIDAPSPDEARSVEELIEQHQSVKRYVRNLEQRIKELEQLLLFNGTHQEEFKSRVLAVLDEKQQQELDKIQKENPIYSFYNNLPEDYEFKIKTDPEYAEQISKELRQKVLDESVGAVERLAAIGQLQMNMYALNRQSLEQLDYEVVDSVLRMSTNLEDEKLKVQALEMLSHTPVSDVRIAQRFRSMLEKEANDYIRSIATEGLMSQYYQARHNNLDYAKQLAREIVSLYENSGDKTVQNLLHVHIGDEGRLQDIKSSAGL